MAAKKSMEATKTAQRMFETRIDIKAEAREQMVELLNTQLAATFDLYSQNKHAHWNVKGRDFMQLHELFDRLAELTGGAVVVLRPNQNLGESFVQAFDEFRASYVLRYAYEGPPQPGWHQLVVRVTRRGQYDVRARQGYFAGN